MGHLEGNFTPVLYMGRKVPKGYACTVVYVGQGGVQWGTLASVSSSACCVGLRTKLLKKRNAANSLNAWLNSKHASA